MKITEKWLEDRRACDKGKEWFFAQEETDGKKVVEKLLTDKHPEALNWANWLIVQIMERQQYIAYAIFAAEQVLSIYKKQHPDNKAPWAAIEAAREVLRNDTPAARAAAVDAAWAARAARAAAGAAVAAAGAARAAAGAARAAAEAAGAAAEAAAEKEIMVRIIKKGIDILKSRTA